MSRLGYFLGGILTGLVGTVAAAYAVDRCSYSSKSQNNKELDTPGESACTKAESDLEESEPSVGSANEEPYSV